MEETPAAPAAKVVAPAKPKVAAPKIASLKKGVNLEEIANMKAELEDRIFSRKTKKEK